MQTLLTQFHVSMMHSNKEETQRRKATVNVFYQDTRYKIQDILLSFCAYNYTHIRQSIQEHNIHKYTIQTQKLQILYKLNCFAVPDKHIQKHI